MAKGKKILVVDDDRSSLEYLTGLLKQSGYEVNAVENGSEALNRFRSNQPDLVISGILMREMDGFQLAHKLRTESESSDIPVIFYSAKYSGPEVHPQLSESEAAQHMGQAASSNVILKAIEAALSQAPPTRRAFDSSLFSDRHIRVLTEDLAEKVQALYESNESLIQTRSELQTATEALRKSEEQYRLLFEANPNPMWVFDIKTLKFLVVNVAAITGYGFSKQEFLNMTVHDIQPIAQRDGAGIEENTEYPQFSEPCKHKKKDGTLSDIEITSRITTFDGHPAKLVLAQDVTLRKKLQETLRQKQKLEAVALLASGVAHDFNNLLGIILGCAELALLRLEDGSPATSKLLDVQSAAHRAARLTRQLMVFSRQEITETLTLDLNDSVGSSERFLRRVIGENIDFSCAFVQQPLNIRIDPSHLEQLLLNLVVNARDAMPKGGRIKIETALTDIDSRTLDSDLMLQPGSYALLTFSDTGQGMSHETCSKIFEPFFTTKEKGKGTGLGLATCEGIVKQAGGNITVESELGVGTTFKIFLPLTSALPEELALVENLAMRAKGETILVTEDESDLRDIIVEFLEESDYKVLRSANGDEAIAVLEERHDTVDLLLSDVVMPGISGAELSYLVARKYPNVNVLLMTGYSDDTLSRQGMARTARVIQKPFTRHALLQKVRTLLDAKKAVSKRYKVLVAEDDLAYQALISEVLESSGFDVLCSKGGTEALPNELIQPVDLAILDIEMSRKRIFEVCQKLKSNPSTADIPVLLVSGKIGKCDEEFALGAHAFLRKPFGSDELLCSIKALLSDKAAPLSTKRSVRLFGGEAGI